MGELRLTNETANVEERQSGWNFNRPRVDFICLTDNEVLYAAGDFYRTLLVSILGAVSFWGLRGLNKSVSSRFYGSFNMTRVLPDEI